jgi:hypothetical protein
MWKINRPTLTAPDTFDTCTAGLSDAATRTRHLSVRAEIALAEQQFLNRAALADLYLTPTSEDVSGVVTKTEMTQLYDRHLVREGSRGRVVYDTLMSAAPNEQCPFCGHRVVSTLDHTLTKSRHPALAVTPVNLVPCCKDCNHLKGNAPIAQKSDQLFNPYFDEVPAGTWLYADVLVGSPAAVRFRAAPPAGWDAVMSARVTRHFQKLELGKLYSSQAGRHLQNIRVAMRRLHTAGGMNMVRAELVRRMESSQADDPNYWMSALYSSLAGSDWYCDAGFDA